MLTGKVRITAPRAWLVLRASTCAACVLASAFALPAALATTLEDDIRLRAESAVSEDVWREMIGAAQARGFDTSDWRKPEGFPRDAPKPSRKPLWFDAEPAWTAVPSSGVNLSDPGIVTAILNPQPWQGGMEVNGWLKYLREAMLDAQIGPKRDTHGAAVARPDLLASLARHPAIAHATIDGNAGTVHFDGITEHGVPVIAYTVTLYCECGSLFEVVTFDASLHQVERVFGHYIHGLRIYWDNFPNSADEAVEGARIQLVPDGNATNLIVYRGV